MEFILVGREWMAAILFAFSNLNFCPIILYDFFFSVKAIFVNL